MPSLIVPCHFGAQSFWCPAILVPCHFGAQSFWCHDSLATGVYWPEAVRFGAVALARTVFKSAILVPLFSVPIFLVNKETYCVNKLKEARLEKVNSNV